MNQRLADALDKGRGREAALRRARIQKGLYHDCGFCGREWTEPVLSGPICGICEDCASMAVGFYLTAARTGLNIVKDFNKVWSSALSDYARVEGRPSEMKPPASFDAAIHEAENAPK